MSTGRIPALRAVVHRDGRCNWVMSWPGGYAYDFWQDQQAAERAATAATRLLQSPEAADRDAVDEALRASTLLLRARVRRPVEVEASSDVQRGLPGMRPVLPGGAARGGRMQQTG